MREKILIAIAVIATFAAFYFAKKANEKVFINLVPVSRDIEFDRNYIWQIK